MCGWCAPESEMAAYPDLRGIEQAYRACRKRKRGTVRSCLYEQQLLDTLVGTTEALQGRYWQPAPPVVFCVQKPKAREVYAAQFQDRVVHHWLVPKLEALLDRKFIYDCTSNRKGKGAHFAVKRLQGFMRKQQRGWLLQLDIANFFNSINQRVLLQLLARHLCGAAKQGVVALAQARYLYWLCRRVITQPVAQQAIAIGNSALSHTVPEHKRLINAASHTGLPIGNLTSQFFANVYMNELDQFIKHQLKCRFYVRYVDDFVLLHHSKAQLQLWQQQIAGFLQQRLKLHLKPQSVLVPLQNGADFLGYIVKPGYRLVRRRVLGNLHEKLQGFANTLLKPVAGGLLLDVPYAEREALRAVLASYWGHLKHADSYRLREALFKRYHWLGLLFSNAQTLQPCWQPLVVVSFAGQCRYFCRHYAVQRLYIQKGNQLLCFTGAAVAESYAIALLDKLRSQAQQARHSFALVTEQGFLPGGLKRRVLRQLWLPQIQQADIDAVTKTFNQYYADQPARLPGVEFNQEKQNDFH